MKNRVIVTIIGILGCLATNAQNPKWYKKARNSQLSVIAYDAKDNMRQGQAFFLNEKGDIATEYDMLKGAEKAIAIDAEGKQYNITHVLGANSLYNVAKLETNNAKIKLLPIAETAAEAQQIVYIMPICNTDKKATCTIDTIAKTQEFGDEKYPYYTLKHAVDERLAGCPVFNENGELLGHIQMPADDHNKPAYILGVKYTNSLNISAIDVNNNDLRAIGISKALPDDESQATSYVFLFNKKDKKAYTEAIRDYINKFPNSSVGYIQLAELQAAEKQYKEAEETYAKAYTMNTGHEDEIHHSFAKLLYQSGLLEESPAEGWNMEHALQEARAAYDCNPLPLYTALQGMCLYAQKDYEASYTKFMEMANTNMRSAEYFLYASQCKQMLKATDEEILALQDSAINCFTKPYPIEAANYLYLRAKTLNSLKRYKEAVTDMNEYEHLLAGNANANFYYEREQMEMQCRMYSAALNDIERAVKLLPEEPVLRAEEAAVNYRVGQLDEAIIAAREAIRLDESFADAHRILGICLRDKGKTIDAKKALQRAIELGDSMAQSILEKM